MPERRAPAAPRLTVSAPDENLRDEVMLMENQADARSGANASQAAEWDGPSGEHRLRHADVFDAEARPHNERFRAAAAVAAGDRVLDIGCGTGQTTRDAARAATAGRALGIDLSARMLAHARRLSAEQGLRNVSYLQADAQLHSFRAASFDLGISRFGTMFFADPVAAFGNIGRALRPGARLVLMVWQDQDRNEWSRAIRQSLTAGSGQPAPAAAAPGPGAFALAEPAVAGRVLVAAGFSEVGLEDVRDPVYYGPDSATAYDVITGLRSTRDLLGALDAGAAESALARLRAVIAAHDTGDGVYFGSRAWIITARR